MHLVEERVVAIGECDSSRVVDGFLEVGPCHLHVVLPVAPSTVGSAIVVVALLLDAQGIAIAVNGSDVAASGLIAAGLKGDAADKALDIGLGEVVLHVLVVFRALANGIHEWLHGLQVVEDGIVDGVA